jgi:hypothetical protein
VFSYYSDEIYWDIISILENINVKNHTDIENERNAIIEYITKELIIFHKSSPMFRGDMERYSGLSMSGQTDDKYNALEFYLLLKEIREIK